MPAPNQQGIVVLSVPRSGTTLLRRLLNAHRNIACPGETHLFRAAAQFVESERGAEGLRIGVLNGLAYAGFEEQEVLERLRSFVFGFHQDYARMQGKTRWAEKSAFDVFHLDAIDRLCGRNAYFVCMIRHGLDVVCSLKEFCDKSQAYLHELHDAIRACPRPLEAFAGVWAERTRALRKFVAKHPDNAVLLRYEDLVQDPAGELRRVLECVGETLDPGLVERAFESREPAGFGDWKTYSRSGIDAQSIERFKMLSPGTIQALAPIVNPTLAECGYEALEVEPEPSDSEARRRYELGLKLQSMKQSQSKSTPDQK